MTISVAIAAATAAASSTTAFPSDIDVAAGASIQVSVSPVLGEDEYVDVFKLDDQDTPVPLVVDGYQVRLTQADSAIGLAGPAKYRLAKSETAVATKVLVDQ